MNTKKSIATVAKKTTTPKKTTSKKTVAKKPAPAKKSTAKKKGQVVVPELDENTGAVVVNPVNNDE